MLARHVWPPALGGPAATPSLLLAGAALRSFLDSLPPAAAARQAGWLTAGGPAQAPPPCVGAARTLTATASTAAPAEQEHPLRRLQSAITPEVCDALRRSGYAVVDGAFGAERAAEFKSEIQALRGQMHMNSTHLVTGAGTQLLEKSHIHEAELMSQETQALAPLCAAVQQDNTLGVMLSLFMPELRLDKHAVKLQWNEGGGGCFPIHFDSDYSVDSRRVTAIIYLNEGWRPGDGGELRLYPFPQPPVDIEPRNDRLVLFSSMHMAHRVLPSAAERYCFTIWLSDTRQLPQAGGKEELRGLLANVEGLAPEAAWRLLLHPGIYKHAVKWAHREEWARSIQESHPASAERDELLSRFWQEAGVVERALGPLLAAAGGAARWAQQGGEPSPHAWFS